MKVMAENISCNITHPAVEVASFSFVLGLCYAFIFLVCVFQISRILYYRFVLARPKFEVPLGILFSLLCAQSLRDTALTFTRNFPNHFVLVCLSYSFFGPDFVRGQ